MSQLPLTGAGPSAAGYIAKVKSYNPIAYWPLNETTGSTAVCQVNTAQNGTYTGVTLGQSVTDANGVSFVCPYFDGANDVMNAWTATFRDAFNGSEGAVLFWMRVFNVGVWTDGNLRTLIRLRVDANNFINIFKHNATNGLDWRYEAGGAPETLQSAALAETNWIQIGLTWSKIADEVKMYYAGAQTGVTRTVLGNWAGLLANTTTCVGASDTVPSTIFNGWLAHCAIWDTPLTAPQIADLAVV